MSPRGFPELKTGRLLLRRLRLEDARDTFAYASDPEVSRYVPRETRRTLHDSCAFLALAIGRYETGEGMDWGIVHRADGRFIGTCGFVSHSPEHARAEIGYVLSRAYRGRDLTTEAVRAGIRFGFERMELNRIEARCVAGNVASARVMEKAGMTFGGTLRESELIQGAYRDMKAYAILRGEFRAGPPHAAP